MIRENDCVRLTESITGSNCYGEGVITKLAGAEGCAIAVFKDACDVQFDDDTFLTVPFSKLVNVNFTSKPSLESPPALSCKSIFRAP